MSGFYQTREPAARSIVLEICRRICDEPPMLGHSSLPFLTAAITALFLFKALELAGWSNQTIFTAALIGAGVFMVLSAVVHFAARRYQR
jgi:hypothetical protein